MAELKHFARIRVEGDDRIGWADDLPAIPQIGHRITVRHRDFATSEIIDIEWDLDDATPVLWLSLDGGESVLTALEHRGQVVPK